MTGTFQLHIEFDQSAEDRVREKGMTLQRPAASKSETDDVVQVANPVSRHESAGGPVWRFDLLDDWVGQARNGWVDLELFPETEGARETWSFWLDEQDIESAEEQSSDAEAEQTVKIVKVKLASNSTSSIARSLTRPAFSILDKRSSDQFHWPDATLNEFANSGTMRLPLCEIQLHYPVKSLTFTYGAQKEPTDSQLPKKAPFPASGKPKSRSPRLEITELETSGSPMVGPDRPFKDKLPEHRLVLIGKKTAPSSTMDSMKASFEQCDPDLYVLHLELNVSGKWEACTKLISDFRPELELTLDAEKASGQQDAQKRGRLIESDERGRKQSFKTPLMWPDDFRLERLSIFEDSNSCFFLQARRKQAAFGTAHPNTKESHIYADEVLLKNLSSTAFKSNGNALSVKRTTAKPPMGQERGKITENDDRESIYLGLREAGDEQGSIKKVEHKRISEICEILDYEPSASSHTLDVFVPHPDESLITFGQPLRLKVHLHKFSSYEKVMVIDYGADVHSAYISHLQKTTQTVEPQCLGSKYNKGRGMVEVQTKDGVETLTPAYGDQEDKYDVEIAINDPKERSINDPGLQDIIRKQNPVLRKWQERFGVSKSDLRFLIPASTKRDENWFYQNARFHLDFLKLSFWLNRTDCIFYPRDLRPAQIMEGAIDILVRTIFADHFSRFVVNDHGKKYEEMDKEEQQLFTQPPQIVITHPAFGNLGTRKQFRKICEEVGDGFTRSLVSSRLRNNTVRHSEFFYPVLTIPEPLAAAAQYIEELPKGTEKTHFLVIDIGKLSLDGIVTTVNPGQHDSANQPKGAPTWGWEHQFCFGMPFAGLHLDFCLIRAVAELLQEKIVQHRTIEIPNLPDQEVFAETLLKILPDSIDKIAPDKLDIVNPLCPDHLKKQRLEELGYHRNIAILRFFEMQKKRTDHNDDFHVKLWSSKSEEPDLMAQGAAQALLDAGLAERNPATGDIWITFTLEELQEAGSFASYLRSFETLVRQALARLNGFDGRKIFVVTGLASKFKSLTKLLTELEYDESINSKIEIKTYDARSRKEVTAMGAAKLAYTPSLCIDPVPHYLHILFLSDDRIEWIEEIGASKPCSKTLTVPPDTSSVILVAGPPGARDIFEQEDGWFIDRPCDEQLEILFPTRISPIKQVSVARLADLHGKEVIFRLGPDNNSSGSNEDILEMKVASPGNDELLQWWQLDQQSIYF